MSEVSTQAKHRADIATMNGSPADLEREIEATRERLAGTLDQLVYRVKPSTIVSRQVQEFKAFFVDAEGNVRKEKVAAVAGSVIGVVVFFATVRRLSNRKG